MVVINPLLGLDVSIEVQPVLINTKDYGKQTWRWAFPRWASNFLLALSGSRILTFALVISVVVETLTRVLSSATLKPWSLGIPYLISSIPNGLENPTLGKIQGWNLEMKNHLAHVLWVSFVSPCWMPYSCLQTCKLCLHCIGLVWN